MLRSQASRIAQTSSKCAARTSRRAYATVPPPPSGQPAPQPKSFEKKDNTLLYVGLGLAGGAGAYYFFAKTDEPADLEKRARRDEERVKVNARQTLDATKDRADDSLAIARAKADQLKDSAKDTIYAGKSKAEQIKDDARREFDTAKGGLRRDLDTDKENFRREYDSAKGTFRNIRDSGVEEGRGLFDKAEDGILHTKEQTEAAFRSTRDAAEQKTAELRDSAKKGGEEVKEGWFSWLGYGKSKVADTEQLARERRNQLEAEADRLKREAARGVANTAEDVRVRAEKHA